MTETVTTPSLPPNEDNYAKFAAQQKNRVGFFTRAYRVTRGTFAVIGLITVSSVGFGGYQGYKFYKHMTTPTKRPIPVQDVPSETSVGEKDIIEGVKDLLGDKKKKVGKHIVLKDLHFEADTSYNFFSKSDQPHENILTVLKEASQDPRVQGIVVDVDYQNLPEGVSDIQELKWGVEAFRKTGKFAYAYSEGAQMGQAAYFLANSFDKIFVLPTAGIDLKGVSATVFFFKNLLDNMGVEVDLINTGPHKTAMNILTQTSFTPEHKEDVENVLTDLYDQIAENISDSRKISKPDFMKLIDEGPFHTVDALKHNLVDGQKYPDEIRQMAIEKCAAENETVHFLSLSDYLRLTKKEKPSGGNKFVRFQKKEDGSISIGLFAEPKSTTKRVALIRLEGPIQSEMSQHCHKGFKEAIKDPLVETIVLRIDSPGGTVHDSDLIWRNIPLAEKAGKQVYVSVGDVCASGGYFVACRSHRIFATPESIVGSIGVFTAKFAMENTFQKIGITTDVVEIGKNSSIWGISKLTESQRKVLYRGVELAFDQFRGRVIEGRKFNTEQINKVATAQVWTGRQALQLGLIDELGGLDDTIQHAKNNFPNAKDVMTYPRPASIFSQLKEAFSDVSGNGIRMYNFAKNPPKGMMEMAMAMQRMATQSGRSGETRSMYWYPVRFSFVKNSPW